ncbi:hypothetical protein F2Q69_00013583 [Brassica cretica]|uniref:Uncharacterized protein n=1 Tax=Brassica cretica TaxID=69181 RepID=A0A8S9R9Q4_BRACR|nr:hypothetical protein F2Q69_00013583 [Brassica cretica]
MVSPSSLICFIASDLSQKLQRPTSVPDRPTNLPNRPWHLLVTLATRKRQKTLDETPIHFRKTNDTEIQIVKIWISELKPQDKLHPKHS